MVIKWIFSLLTVLAVQNHYVYAQETDYTTEHKILYFLSLDKTTVSHTIDISIKNKYKGIQNMSFREPTSELENLTLKTKDKNTSIENIGDKIYINFDNLVVGPKTKTVQFSFDSKSIFKRFGNTYVLDIPKVEDSKVIKNFSLKVYFPKEREHIFSSKHKVYKTTRGGTYTLAKKSYEDMVNPLFLEMKSTFL